MAAVMMMEHDSPHYLCQGSYVFIGVSSFVWWQNYGNTIQSIFTEFREKVARRPLKKPLDFGGNPDHVTLASRLQSDGGITILCMCYPALV